MLRSILLLLSGTCAFAQQYTIATVAGGAPPATPVAATSAAIGQTRRVALDAAGNLYFSAGNSVYKMSGSNIVLVAGNSRAGFSGDGGPAIYAQLNAPAGMAFDSSGNIYIADSGNNRVRIVDQFGIINTFAGSGAVSPGGARSYNDGGPAIQGLLHLPMAVAINADGNILIADTGDNLIRIVTPDGLINTYAGDSYPGFLGDGGSPASCELHTPSDIFVDKSGAIYIADQANARLRKVASGVINTIAGTGAIGYSGDAAAATSANLWAPTAVTVDSSGNVYIVESGDARIRKIDSSANINTIAGNGTIGFSGDGSTATNATMNLPTGIVVDSSGNLYIADSANLRIRKIASGSINTIAGNGLQSYSGDNAAAIAAQMDSPAGVAADAAGNFYVSDTNNNEVRKVAPNGIITRYAGNASAGFGGDNGQAASAQLNGPQGLATDASGNLYIADTGNARVRKVAPDGTITTVAGNGTPGFGGDNGSATGAQLSTPTAVAVDGAGNLYIADLGNNRVRKVASGTITTAAGNGNPGYSGDGGDATSAQLQVPKGVAVDAAGNLYIADSGNNVVRLVANGKISTFAGTGAPGSTGDGGQAASAQLSAPAALAVDSVGSVYVTDGRTLVRRILPYGLITTVAGNGTLGYSGDGGAATSAQINAPTALAASPAGTVYVADTGNNAVRALQAARTGLNLSAVTNAASNQVASLAPGELIILWGSGLGPSPLAQASLGSNGAFPTSLGGISVMVNGVLAPMYYASANQTAAIVPFEVSGSAAQVVVVNQGQTSAAKSVNVAAVAPGLFTADMTGAGQALAVNVSDHSLNGPSHPASAGQYVVLYATGMGQTNPPGQNGVPFSGSGTLPALSGVTATIGGKQATVQYAGGAAGIVAGVAQVNVQVPGGLTAGAAEVVLKIGGASTQSGVTIQVQ